MNTFKKIGLTALAGSLVAVSAYAGEISVAGSASMKVRHVDGGSDGKAFSMGNQLTFSGGGEMDNGLNVDLSMVIDQADNSTFAGGPFDSHSVKLSSDTFGTLTFSGEGGGSAQSSIDGTAAGDLWDNGFGISTAQDPKTSSATTNMFSYKLPSLMDDLSINTSFVPSGADMHESATSIALSYTGVAGLTLDYGVGDDKGTKGAHASVTTMKAAYAFADFPVTLSYSKNSYDSDATGTSADQDVTGYEIAYTVSDDLSVSYGMETIEEPDDTTAEDIDVSGIVVSYTTGGMTLKAMVLEAENTNMTTTTDKDKDAWSLEASFAF
jgi:outer membrane protein OmpU